MMKRSRVKLKNEPGQIGPPRRRPQFVKLVFPVRIEPRKIQTIVIFFACVLISLFSWLDNQNRTINPACVISFANAQDNQLEEEASRVKLENPVDLQSNQNRLENLINMIIENGFFESEHQRADNGDGSQTTSSRQLKKLLARPKHILSSFVPQILSKQLVLKRPNNQLKKNYFGRIHHRQFLPITTATTDYANQHPPRLHGLHQLYLPNQMHNFSRGLLPHMQFAPLQSIQIDREPSHRQAIPMDRHSFLLAKSTNHHKSPNKRPQQVVLLHKIRHSQQQPSLVVEQQSDRGNYFDNNNGQSAKDQGNHEAERGLNRVDQLIKNEFETRINLNDQIVSNQQLDDANDSSTSGVPSALNGLVVEQHQQQQQQMETTTVEPSTSTEGLAITLQNLPVVLNWPPDRDQNAASDDERDAIRESSDDSTTLVGLTPKFESNEDKWIPTDNPILSTASPMRRGYRSPQDQRQSKNGEYERNPAGPFNMGPRTSLLPQPSPWPLRDEISKHETSRQSNRLPDPIENNQRLRAIAAFVPSALETIAQLRLNQSVAQQAPGSEIHLTTSDSKPQLLSAQQSGAIRLQQHKQQQRQAFAPNNPLMVTRHAGRQDDGQHTKPMRILNQHEDEHQQVLSRPTLLPLAHKSSHNSYLDNGQHQLRHSTRLSNDVSGSLLETTSSLPASRQFNKQNSSRAKAQRQVQDNSNSELPTFNFDHEHYQRDASETKRSVNDAIDSANVLSETLRRLRETKSRIRQLQAELNASQANSYMLTAAETDKTVTQFVDHQHTPTETANENFNSSQSAPKTSPLVAAGSDGVNHHHHHNTDWFRSWSRPFSVNGSVFVPASLIKAQNSMNLPLGMYHNGPLTAPARLVASALGRAANKAAGGQRNWSYPVSGLIRPGPQLLTARPSSAPILLTSTIKVSNDTIDGDQLMTTVTPITMSAPNSDMLITPIGSGIDHNSANETENLNNAMIRIPFEPSQIIKGNSASVIQQQNVVTRQQETMLTGVHNNNNGPTMTEEHQHDTMQRRNHTHPTNVMATKKPFSLPTSTANPTRSESVTTTSPATAPVDQTAQVLSGGGRPNTDIRPVQPPRQSHQQTREDRRIQFDHKQPQSPSHKQVATESPIVIVEPTASVIGGGHHSGQKQISSWQANNITLGNGPSEGSLSSRELRLKPSINDTTSSEHSIRSNDNFIIRMFNKMFEKFTGSSQTSGLDRRNETLGGHNQTQHANQAQTVSSSKLTTEKVVNILILSACSLAIICLVVAVTIVRCRYSKSSSKALGHNLAPNSTLLDASDQSNSPKALDWRRYTLNANGGCEQQQQYTDKLIFDETMRNVSLLARHGHNLGRSRHDHKRAADRMSDVPLPMLNRSCCHCVYCSESWLFRDNTETQTGSPLCSSGFYHPAPRGKLPFGAASSVNNMLLVADHENAKEHVKNASLTGITNTNLPSMRVPVGGTRLRMMSAIDETDDTRMVSLQSGQLGGELMQNDNRRNHSENENSDSNDQDDDMNDDGGLELDNIRCTCNRNNTCSCLDHEQNSDELMSSGAITGDASYLVGKQCNRHHFQLFRTEDELMACSGQQLTATGHRCNNNNNNNNDQEFSNGINANKDRHCNCCDNNNISKGSLLFANLTSSCIKSRACQSVHKCAQHHHQQQLERINLDNNNNNETASETAASEIQRRRANTNEREFDLINTVVTRASVVPANDQQATSAKLTVKTVANSECGNSAEGQCSKLLARQSHRAGCWESEKQVATDTSGAKVCPVTTGKAREDFKLNKHDNADQGLAVRVSPSDCRLQRVELQFSEQASRSMRTTTGTMNQGINMHGFTKCFDNPMVASCENRNGISQAKARCSHQRATWSQDVDKNNNGSQMAGEDDDDDGHEKQQVARSSADRSNKKKRSVPKFAALSTPLSLAATIQGKLKRKIIGDAYAKPADSNK